MRLYLYADAQSQEVLESARSKAVLLGSDFGYGNFGDVLQHMGAASRFKAAGVSVASILTVDAISRHVSVSALRKGYGVDALLFVSTGPLDAQTVEQLGLQKLHAVRNVACIQLYGGGFLNKMWGDFVLSVAEFFLERLPGVPYVISGQQVSEGYESRFAEHVSRFVPKIVGVRDHDSLSRVNAHGVNAEFSFDDATELLYSFGEKCGLEKGDGAFVHLNTSGYTGNNEALGEIQAHLGLVANQLGPKEPLLLLQAFQDAREDVIDTLESVKRLETAFPFSNFDTCMLVATIKDESASGSYRLRGRFGYSSSYHVTLWLQLAGIPCWLRGSNEYYQQKRKALGIDSDFETFLDTMPLPDHSDNLHARQQWLERLSSVLEAESSGTQSMLTSSDAEEPAARVFHFKGEPRLAERLDEVWSANRQMHRHATDLDRQVDGLHLQVEGLNGQIEGLNRQIEGLGGEVEGLNAQLDGLNRQLELSELHGTHLSSRLNAAIDQLSELGTQCHDLRGRLNEAEAGWASSRQEAMQSREMLEASELRVEAYGEQLTAVGSEARQYHDQLMTLQASNEVLVLRDAQLSDQLRIVMSSRSWRWTRPVRVVTRFLGSGRFDVEGKVGVYRVLQLSGQKMPIPQRWRSAIGRLLTRARRR